jgi:membrane protease subunit HflK
MEFGSNGSVEDAVVNGSNQFNLPSQGNLLKAIIGLVLFVLIVGGVLSAFYKVDTEEMAVILRLGKYAGTAGPGLQVKLPFGIDKVFLVKTERIMKEEFGFRSMIDSGRTTYKKKDFAEESLILTGDLNVSDLEWIVQFKIEDPFKFLFNISDPVNTIRDISEAVTRKIVGDANVSDVLTTERAVLAQTIQDELQKVLNSYEMGVRIITCKFQDVNPPEKVKAAFNGVNEAEQQKESLIQQAREEYNKEVPRARGQAKQMIQEAEGYALERVNRAQGEVARFLALLDEYKKFPEVTRKRLYLETLEKIMPRIKDATVLDGQDGKNPVLPILPLQSLEGVAR